MRYDSIDMGHFVTLMGIARHVVGCHHATRVRCAFDDVVSPVHQSLVPGVGRVVVPGQTGAEGQARAVFVAGRPRRDLAPAPLVGRCRLTTGLTPG
jgi:hypothetical protein